MERSEPSLVPEWLKNGGSGSVTGSGTSTHPLSSSSSNSDDHALSKLARNKSSVNSSDHDLGRSSALDRTSSSYFRRSSSSNGSAHLRSYSSFGRNQRGGRDWDKDIYESRDKDKSVFGDLKHRDYLDQLGNIYPSRFEKDGLRSSQSMISGKRGEGLPRKTSADSTAPRNDSIEGNGLLNKVGSIGSTHKAAFERDFPSLGSEERLSTPEIGRVPSPGLSSSLHGLPASAAIGGDKWISALAEVPAMVGSSGTGISSGQQTPVSSGTSLVLSTTTGLNMAEAVAQGPPRAHTVPQLSAGTQRLEELVIKQSRQLIPVTPSMPKPLALGSLDKVKTKAGLQQHPASSSLSPSFRAGPVKSDASKTSNSGKLLVLKPARERNGVAPAAKDSLSPTNNSKAANSPLAVALPVGALSASRGSSNNPLSPSADRKNVPAMLEKRPTPQAQSRSDFFNLVRKKSMAASMSVPDPGPGPAVSPSIIPCKASEQDTVPAPATYKGRDVPLTDNPSGCESTESKGSLTCNGDAFDGDIYRKNGRNHFSSSPKFSEEEEAAFLRSLGWEENAEEEGGLTEEEIGAFLTKHFNSKLSLKLFQGVEPRILLPLSSQVGTISSGLSSSDSKLES